MLKNWLVTNFRSILRNKSYALINIVGLALGMSCSLVIYMLIQYDLSFDSFQPNIDRIYRVVTVGDASGDTGPGTPFPIAEALRTDFPQIEKVVQTLYEWDGQITISNEFGAPLRFREANGVAFAGPEFLEVFYHQWLQGNPAGALHEPNTVVLTESWAKKFFPNEDPLDRMINLNNQLDLRVIGVIADLPPNSNFPFKMLASLSSLKGYHRHYDLQHWNIVSSNAQVYVLLPEGMAPEQIESQFKQFVIKYSGEKTARHRTFALQPFLDIHFDTDIADNFVDRTVSKATLLALALIAVFLVVTACINFINLATAQALKRAKEVGIRKVVGSSRKLIVFQFLGETGLITLLAALFAIAISEFLLTKLNQFVDVGAGFDTDIQSSGLAFVAICALAVVAMAGVYPAIVLSRFNPVQALKSRITARQAGTLSLRKGLVVSQFIISQVLIICTIVVTDQTEYFQTKSLGFEKEAIVTVPLPNNDEHELQALKTRLLERPQIERVTFGFAAPSAENNAATNFIYEGYDGDERLNSEVKMVDQDYFDTFGLQLLAGRAIAVRDSAGGCVVNETLLQVMGVTEPEQAVGKMIRYGDEFEPIVGVVKNFHTRSLHLPVAAVVLAYRPNRFQQASIKIHPENMKEALAHIEGTWQVFFPECVFTYEFVAETLRSFYEQEKRLGELVRFFSGIAIFIGCLGLYGLVSFMVEQKTKEIGIRKVLSASVFSILLLFTSEFAKVLALAFAAAAPIAYVGMNHWLTGFAYRIEIGPGVFALAALTTFVIAALTVGYKSVKAALANPIQALRYE